MITNALLLLINAVIGFFDALMPHFSPPTWLGSVSTFGSTLAQYLGGALGVVQPILPVDAMIQVAAALLTVLPVIGAYTVFQWVWNHVPMVAGFGTH